MQKKELRQEIRNRKRQFTEEQLRELSLPVINKLLAHPRVNNATTLMLYYSMPDEVYTHELIDLLVKKGLFRAQTNRGYHRAGNGLRRLWQQNWAGTRILRPLPKNNIARI